MSIFLLWVCLFAFIANIGSLVGMTFAQSSALGILGTLVTGFWTARFMSRPQSPDWRQSLQAAMGKIAAFAVGGCLTSLALLPLGEILSTEITCLMGTIAFAIGPVKAVTWNARRLG